MSSLRGRLFAVFAALGLAMLLAVGGGLFVVLRGLHQEASAAALGDLAVPLLSQARNRLGRGLPPRAVLEALREDAGATGISIFLVGADGRVLPLDASDAPARFDIPVGGQRGDVERGVVEVPGSGAYTYVSATLFGDRSPGGARALVLARPDDSGRRALADLARALLVAGLVLLAVGAPLAVWLARSVGRPLERLAAAARDVGRGELPPPLPVDGPDEVAHASASFNAMTAEVARARRTQDELLANLRHDLRTPLTVIGGFASALLDRTARGAQATRAAQAIADETARLERLVDDLGALADLERGGRPLRHEQLDAAELAREAAQRFSGPAAAAGQAVRAEAPAALPMAADRTALERILGNLVANGLAAAPSPGGSVVVEAVALGSAEVVLAVRDDGPGIPGDALERVFERFYRGDPARAGAGSGLGLAIVAELARAHGGRAFAERPAGGGARVGVVLPVSGHVPPVSGHAPPETAGGHAAAASPTLSPVGRPAPADRPTTMEEPTPVTDPSA